MPQYQIPLGGAVQAYADLDEFTQGYIEAMMFCECNSDNDELAEMTFDDIATDTLANIMADCAKFQSDQGALLGAAYAEYIYDEAQAGRDFWFTRNGHGVGFWDRMIGEIGDALAEACKPWRELYVYAGDDKKLHIQ